MKVSKWGNSLAVRLPASLVEELNLKDGDEIELTPRSSNVLEVSDDEKRRRALEQMRKLRFKVPAGYKFDREEANARGPYTPVKQSKPGSAAD